MASPEDADEEPTAVAQQSQVFDASKPVKLAASKEMSRTEAVSLFQMFDYDFGLLADHTYLEGKKVRIIDRMTIKKAAPNHQVSRGSYMSMQDPDAGEYFSKMPEFQRSQDAILHSANRNKDEERAPVTPLV